jgi:hypothetical protein
MVTTFSFAKLEKSIAPENIGAVRPQMAIAPKWTYSKKGRWMSFGNTGHEGVWARVRWAAWFGFNDGKWRTRTGQDTSVLYHSCQASASCHLLGESGQDDRRCNCS